MEAKVKNENSNIKNKKFLSLFEYLFDRKIGDSESAYKDDSYVNDIDEKRQCMYFIIFDKGSIMSIEN